MPHQAQITLHPLLLLLGICRWFENALSEIFDNALACNNAVGINICSQKGKALIGRLELDFFGVQGKSQPAQHKFPDAENRIKQNLFVAVD
jgi:hypothetical protein